MTEPITTSTGSTLAIESDGLDRIITIAMDALPALLDAADERDRLLTVADTLGRVNGEYAMEIHRCRESLGVDEDTDPHHAAQALAAAVERVRALHAPEPFEMPNGEVWYRCGRCQHASSRPCATIRALDGTDDGPTT